LIDIHTQINFIIIEKGFQELHLKAQTEACDCNAQEDKARKLQNFSGIIRANNAN
jgi:hypothetical protein